MEEKSVGAADADRMNGFRNSGQHDEPTNECHGHAIGYRNRD
jgi:hypothetical protein